MRTFMTSLCLAAGLMLSVSALAAAPATPGAAPAAPGASAPSTVAPAAPATPGTAPTQGKAAKPEAPGGGPVKVWVSSGSKSYHCQGDRWYGRTKSGGYMTEAEAKAKGLHGPHGKACTP